MFFGRKEELDYLNQCYTSDGFQFIVVYGRRRVGKTMMLSEFAEGKRVIYHMAEEASSHLQIEALSEVVLSTLGKPSYLDRLDSYEKIISYVADRCKDERLLLILDEFPYLASNDKGLISKLQKWVDLNLKNSKLMLILCGSSVSFMEDKILAHKSPLYGRTTGQMEIEPFDFYGARKFFESYTPEEQVKAYGIVGGVPLYLDLWNPNLDLSENIKALFLGSFGSLYEEPHNILKQELREPMLYSSIINAIATGASRLNEIATKVGEPADKTGVYLKTLMLLKLVRKIKPAYEKEKSRRTIYKLDDALFRFIYRFIYPNRLLIKQKKDEVILEDKIMPYLSDFTGPVFEKVCMDYLIRESSMDRLGFYIEEIGPWWGNDPVKKQEAEIDIVASGGGHAIIAECKFSNEKQGMEVLTKLMHRGTLLKTEDVLEYWIFSQSGFSESLLKKAEEDASIKLVLLEEMM
jgi:AAA+ ATPase superfamily predicted ATPase